MRAHQLTAYEGPSALALAEVDEPRSDGHILVSVEAIGINFPDLLATQGLYQLKPPLPFVPGCEVAGIVLEGPPDTDWTPGTRVAAFTWTGGYAERVAVDPSATMTVPDEIDFVTAAALIVNYQTVHFALQRRGGLRPGETALVLGAAGGIGTAAVQVARGLGARVIAGVARDEQLAVAESAGADEALVLTQGFAARVKELAPDGVDVVLDPLGDWLFDEAIRALAPEGRILVVGFAAGEIPTVRVNRLLLRNVSAVGVAWGAFLERDPGITARAGGELYEMYRAGTVRPHIGATFSFEEIPAALTALQRGEFVGKAVVDMRRS